MNPIDFEEIKQSPAFKHEMAVVLQEMQDMGSDAGYIYRMKSLSESLLPDFVKMVTSNDTPTGTKFEMIKWAAEMARLKEKPAKTAAELPRGPSVIFQFGAGLPVGSMKVVGISEEERPMLRSIEVQGDDAGYEGFS